MNPNNLIDQSTGRVLASEVMRQSHKRAAILASRGYSYRAEFARELRLSWEVARSYADCWRRERSNGMRPMLYTGGRDLDGLTLEEWA